MFDSQESLKSNSQSKEKSIGKKRRSMEKLTKAFMRAFNITKRFGLTPDREELFLLYFSSYFTKKFNYQYSSLLRSPISQSPDGDTIAGRLYRSIDNTYTEYETVAEQLMQEAKMKASAMVESARAKAFSESGVDMNRLYQSSMQNLKGVQGQIDPQLISQMMNSI